MLQAGILVPVTEATPLINSFVLVESKRQPRTGKVKNLPLSNQPKQGCD